MRRARCRTTLLATLAIFAALGWPMLLGRIYVGDDLANFHLPLRAFYAECLAAGDRFDWCPKIFCGFSLHGEGQVGMYHPLHLLLYRFLPLATAFNLELSSGYVLMFLGTSAFLARRGLPRDAARYGAMVFTFSGFNLLHYMHLNFVTIVAHLPWLLIAVDALVRDERRRGAAGAMLGISLLTASQLLIGYPQAVWLSCLCEALFAAWLTATSRGEGPGVPLTSAPSRAGLSRVARLLVAFLGAKALGVLLGCIQLIPTWETANHSVRAAPSPGFLGHGSLHPANLIQLVAPYLFRDRFFTRRAPMSIGTHELGIYAGATVPVLLGWLWIRREALGPARPLAIGAAGLGLVALLLSFGEYGPLFEWIIQLPLVGLFRSPGRSIVLFHLAAAILSAVALTDLGRLDARLPWRTLWPLGLIPALSLALWMGAVLLVRLPADEALAPFLAPAGRIAVGPILIGVATAAVLAAARRWRGALVGLILFAAADQAAYGLTFIWRAPPTSIAALLESRPVPPDAVGQRVKVGEGDDLWIMKGVSLVDGYVALTPSRHLHYEDRAALRIAGVHWIRANTPDGRWEPLPGPLPRARLVTQAVARPFLGGPEVGRGVDPSFAFTHRPLALPGGRPGEAVIVEDRPGAIRIATATPTRQLLVVTERFHEDWRARMDGQLRPVLRVNGDFLGCVVEPGRHSTELRMESRSLRLGLRLSATGAALWALLFLYWITRPIESSPRGADGAD